MELDMSKDEMKFRSDVMFYRRTLKKALMNEPDRTMGFGKKYEERNDGDANNG